jgi:glycosyltransferase involved in cell wall biosynthesis
MTYFPESCFAYFEPEDHEDLARAIQALHDEPELAARLVRRAGEVNEPYRWPRQAERYLRVIEALRGPRRIGRQILTEISLASADYPSQLPG